MNVGDPIYPIIAGKLEDITVYDSMINFIKVRIFYGFGYYLKILQNNGYKIYSVLLRKAVK